MSSLDEIAKGLAPREPTEGTFRPTRVRWYVMGLLGVITALMFLDRLTLTMAVAFIQDEFGFSTPFDPHHTSHQMGIPNIIVHIKPPGGWEGDFAGEDALAWRVPVDDEHHAVFTLGFRPGLVGEEANLHLERMGPTNNTRSLELVEAVLRGDLRIEDVEASEPRSGIGVVQDAIALMGLGTIPDRTIEHLGREDAGMILRRTIWAREIQALVEGRPLKQWYRPDRLLRDNYIAKAISNNSSDLHGG